MLRTQPCSHRATLEPKYLRYSCTDPLGVIPCGSGNFEPLDFGPRISEHDGPLGILGILKAELCRHPRNHQDDFGWAYSHESSCYPPNGHGYF